VSKSEETRQHIVVHAAALFNQHGFEGTSLAALMAATGLEKGRHLSALSQQRGDCNGGF
jgi:TetR/AcrR family transcriptional regulator, transcriptional repressor for nem operon